MFLSPQDKTDDVTAGVKSTALLFGDSTKPILAGFSTIFLTLTAYSVALATPALESSAAASMDFASLASTVLSTHPFFACALAASAAHLTWQIKGVDLNSRPDCWKRFLSNQYLGLIIWLGLAADLAYHVAGPQSEKESAPEQNVGLA